MAEVQSVIKLMINGEGAGFTLKQMTEEARALRKELETTTDRESEDYKLKKKQYQDLTALISDERKEIRGIGDDVDKQESTWTKMKGWVTAGFGFGVGEMIANVATQLFSWGKGAVTAFNDAAQSSAQLQASLDSTKGAAGLTRTEIDKLSEALAKKTRFDDDAVGSSQALLLTFTGIKKGVYEQALPAILDMSEKMGGDSPETLKSTTIQVGKALNNPIEGMTALKKVGVTFTDAQKEVIQKMQETGDLAGAQKIILAELNTEFGGSAEAAAKAGTGGLTVLNNRLGNLTEGAGGLIVSFVEKLYPVLSKGMDILEALVEHSQPVVDVFNEWWNVIGDLFSSVGGLIAQILPFNNTADGTATIMKVVAGAFNLAIIPLKIFLGFVQAGVDYLSILINTGKSVANFFGAEFKLDPKANFDTLANNATKNFDSVKNSFTNAFVEHPKKIESAAVAAQTDLTKKVAQAETEEHKKEREKREKEAEKSRKKEETEEAKKEETIRKQRIKDGEEATKILDALYVKSIKDDLDRKIVQLMQKHDKEAEHIQKLLIDEKQKDLFLKDLNVQLLSDIEKSKREHDDKIKKENDKKAKDEETANNKKVKDDESAQKKIEDQTKARIKTVYDAEIALNDLELLNAGNNQKKILAAKQNRIDVELKESLRKLEAEYKAETIFAEKNGQDVKAIEAKYNAQKEVAEAQHQKKKKDIEEDALKQRQEINKKFFDGIAGLMKGDLVAFGQGVAAKLGLEKKALSEKQQMAVQGASAVMDLAQEALEFLKKKNEERLKNELDTIKKETDAKRKALDEQLKATEAKLESERAAEMAAVQSNIAGANLDAKTKEELEKALTESKAAMNEKYRKEQEIQEKALIAEEKAVNEQYLIALNAAELAKNTEEIARIKSAKDAELAAIKAKKEAVLEKIKTEKAAETEKEAFKIREAKLGADKAKEIEQDLANKKKAIDDKYNSAISKNRTNNEKEADELNKDQQEKEKAARLKAFDQQKKLNIKMAVLNGAQAILMALATTPFPLNLGIGLLIAAKTIIDINRIKKESPPEFAMGRKPNYFKNAGVPDGPSHAEGGIKLVDDAGNVHGEMEGMEPIAIFNKNLYKNNRGVIDKLLHKSLRGDNSPLFENGRYPNYDENGESSDDGGGESSGAGSSISAEEGAALAQKSTMSMEKIVENTGLALEKLDRIAVACESFPREIQAHVAFQEIQSANAQAGAASDSNSLG